MDGIQVAFSNELKGHYGISGHVGVGHAHSHSGFVQDDSVGFAVAASILKMAVSVNTHISSAEASGPNGEITVKTVGGGIGSAKPRRGITPDEANMIKHHAKGLDTIFCQSTAMRVFGRVYGQGAAETAAAFEGACALAALDTFIKAAPERFHIMKEKLANKHDTAAAVVIDINKIPVALMLVINFTEGGIGPDEDYEGNTDWSDKGRIMREVGLDHIPTIVLESKAYIPSLSPSLADCSILIRAQSGIDNTDLAMSLDNYAESAGIPHLFRNDLMPLAKGAMRKLTDEFANKLIALAEKLKTVDSAMEKVNILADMNRLCSEDGGGITFMSGSVCDESRGCGLIKRISAVVSMAVTDKYHDAAIIPALTDDDVLVYEQVALNGLMLYAKNDKTGCR